MANEKVSKNKEKASVLKANHVKRGPGTSKNSPYSGGDRATLGALEQRMKAATPPLSHFHKGKRKGKG